MCDSAGNKERNVDMALSRADLFRIQFPVFHLASLSVQPFRCMRNGRATVSLATFRKTEPRYGHTIDLTVTPVEA